MPRSSIRGNGALGVAFQACRALQFACLIAVLGMTARFISEMVDNTQQPPAPLIGTLCVTCFAILYVIITYLLYFDNQLQKHYTVVSDTLFFISLTITSVIIGKPLSYLSCKAIGAATSSGFDPSKSFTDALNQGPTTTASAVTTTITAAATGTAATYLQPESGTVQHLRLRSDIYMHDIDYSVWVAGTERTCDMMKAIWGLVIALTILFAFSILCLAFLWKKERAPSSREKEIRSFEP